MVMTDRVVFVIECMIVGYNYCRTVAYLIGSIDDPEKFEPSMTKKIKNYNYICETLDHSKQMTDV